ncbi:MAG: hypothetical protein IJW73_08785 [Candidatus Gastranaerophilales bacterium]|nr:hypothetical protein [Candidatus Gastranaerophilales bacterium]
MKKIILLFAIFFSFFFVNTSANAVSVLEPQWAEFCPPLYENAVFKPAKENSKRDLENNYWALRKAKFEKSIMECKVISKTPAELNQCYGRVANLEKNKTQQKREAKYERNDDLHLQIMDGGHWWY